MFVERFNSEIEKFQFLNVHRPWNFSSDFMTRWRKLFSENHRCSKIFFPWHCLKTKKNHNKRYQTQTDLIRLCIKSDSYQVNNSRNLKFCVGVLSLFEASSWTWDRFNSPFYLLFFVFHLLNTSLKYLNVIRFLKENYY